MQFTVNLAGMLTSPCIVAGERHRKTLIRIHEDANLDRKASKRSS